MTGNELRLTVTILLAVTACTSTPEDAVTTTEGTQSARYLALGDSYTIGESVEPDERWPVQLARQLENSGLSFVDVQIVARTGWTTSELAQGVDGADPAGPFDLVTLLIGVNNQFRGLDLDEYRTEFEALVDRAVGFAGGDPERVIVVSIPDWG
jgi:lysophospholipase L1-like esterase